MRYLIIILITLMYVANINLSAFGSEECEGVYNETKQLILQDNKKRTPVEDINHRVAIAASVVSGTERYLNCCIDHKKSIEIQATVLSHLSALARLGCTYRDASTQVIDVHGNDNPALLLHTVLRGCEDRPEVYDSGFSALFFLDKTTGDWKGHSLWPVSLLEGESLQDWSLDSR